MKKRLSGLALALFYPLLNTLLQFVVQFVPALFAALLLPRAGSLHSLYLENFLGDLSAAWLPIFAVSSGLFLLIVGLIFHKRGVSLGQMLFSRPLTARQGVLCLLLGLSMYLFTAQLLEIVPFPESWMQRYTETWENFEQSLSVSSFLLYTLLLAPVMEEIIFRGLTLPALRTAMPVWSAVLLQAVLFGAFHMNMMQFSYALLPGVVLGLAGVLTGSLRGPVIMHIVYNSAGFFVGDFIPPPAPWGYALLAVFLMLSTVLLILLRNPTDASQPSRPAL